MSAKDKVIKQLQDARLVRDKTGTFGSTTLDAAAAAGETTLTVAAITNFDDGDLIRVGSGDEMELCKVNGAPAGTTITLEKALVYDHALGSGVVEQVGYDLGDIGDAGVTINWAGESSDINVSTKRLIFTTLNGYVDAGTEFSLPTMTLQNLAHALGIQLSEILGAGTASDFRQLTTDGSEFGAEQNMSIVANGVLEDGTFVSVELWGVDMDYTGVNFPLSRGTLAPVPIRAIASAGGMVTTTLPTWTADTSITPTKGDTFDAISEVGLFVDGTGTTLTAGPAAGANSIAVASASGIAADGWLKLGSGDTAEFHQVESVVTLTVTLRSRLYRAHANGAAVTKVTQTKFAGVGEDGVQFQTGGTVTPLRTATKRLSIGLRKGNASVQLSVGIIEITLANLAYALGIPQGDIASNRLPFNSNIGTATIDGFYVKGALQDGTIMEVQAWGSSLDVSQVQLILNNSGPASVIPLTVKPSSAINFLQHAA